jgi:EmrB/QacA subfamily drug resistance transporter
MSERGSNWLVPVLVLVIGTFVSVLDVTIVNVAIPTIRTDLGVSTTDVQWITTAYALTIGVLVPASGWLADRFGLRRVYIVALIGFALTSALCGLAWDLPSLVAFRILQAVPGGVLPVITLSMVYQIVPPKEIGAAMGVFGLGVVLAPAAGPTLGGYLVEYLNWRLIFFSNVPIGLLGALAAFVVLTDFPKPPIARFDAWGFVTIATSLFALLLAFTKAPDWGWSSYPVGMLVVAGLLCLALFVVIELEVDDPLLDVRLFARWPFTNSLLLLTALSVGMFAVLFYVPLFLQAGQGITPLRAGLIMLPEAIVMGAISPLSGMLYDWIGPRWPAAIGLAIAAYGTYLLRGITADVPESQIVLWTCVRGFGTALAMMAIITAGLASVPGDKVNRASAINNVGQRITSALGLALLVALESHSQAQLMADRAGLVDADTLTNSSPAGQSPDPETLYLVWKQLYLQVTAASYADIFLVVALITVAGAAIALLLDVTPGTQPASPPVSAGTPETAAAERQPETAERVERADPEVPAAPAAVPAGQAGPPREFTGPMPRTPVDARARAANTGGRPG